MKLFGVGGGFQRNGEEFAISKMECETGSFKWKIQNFTAFSNLAFKSRVFTVGTNNKYCWQLSVDTKKKDSTANDSLNVFLYLVDFGDGDSNSPERSVKTRFQMSVNPKKSKKLKLLFVTP